MRRSIIGLVVLTVLGTGAYAVFAGAKCSSSCTSPAKASAANSSCSSDEAAASCKVAGGKIAGRFDPAMSGACRYGCATKLKYKAKDVLAQPGAKAGKLTQCPVSGVVFAVDANRPHVRIAKDEYVTCCDKCAEKLKRSPRDYLKA